jgi:CheY-like chemotaxis protein
MREGTTAMPGSEAQSGKRILVVDDEAPLASLIAEILSSDGHQVDTAVNGLAALAHIERNDYDLILSDLRMPELDGPGLYRELARRRPELISRIAFVTGSAQSAGMEQFLEKTGAPILYKPFRVEDLQKLTIELLNRRA